MCFFKNAVAFIETTTISNIQDRLVEFRPPPWAMFNV